MTLNIPLMWLFARRTVFISLKQRFDRDDMHRYSVWWQERIAQSVHEMPDEWVNSVFDQTAKLGG